MKRGREAGAAQVMLKLRRIEVRQAARRVPETKDLPLVRGVQPAIGLWRNTRNRVRPPAPVTFPAPAFRPPAAAAVP